MGKLNGILPIEGTVGNITFSKSKDGIIVRQKGGVSARRIANDPAFRRTRENNNEFGTAGKTARMLLAALRSTARAKADSRAMSRLVKILMAAQKADTTSPRGQRKVSNGTPVLLEGFELNTNAPLAATFYAPYAVSLNRGTGSFELSLPAALTPDSVAAPAGATHYTLQAACVLADFDTLTATPFEVVSTMLPVDNPPAIAALVGSFTAGYTLPILVVLSISFYQEVNGSHYLLSNGAYNPASIIKVDD